MNVLLVRSGFKYSTADVARGYEDALQRLGHNVTVVDLFDTYSWYRTMIEANNIFGFRNRQLGPEDCREMASQALPYYCILHSIDIAICIHGGHIHSEIVEALNKIGVITAVVLTDEPQQVDASRQWATPFQYVFTNEMNTVAVHKEHHPDDKVYYLPTGVNEDLWLNYKGIEREPFDILVPGTFYPERLAFIHHPDFIRLLDTYESKLLGPADKFTDNRLINIHINGRFPIETFIELKRAAKIVIDIPRDGLQCNAYPDCNKGRIKPSGVSPRVFEVPLVDSLLVTFAFRDHLKDHFEVDEEIVVYNDINDLVEKVRYYLEHEDERKAIIEKSKQRVLSEHTYKHRAKTIIDICSESLKAKLPTDHKASIKILNKATINQFEDLWGSNFESMRDVFDKADDITRFEGVFHEPEHVAVLVSNASSINYHLKHLKALTAHDRFADRHGYRLHHHIFTVNSAINLLDQHAIPQDFSVIIHPTSDQPKHFNKIEDLTGQLLLLASTCHRNVYDEWTKRGGRVGFFHTTPSSHAKALAVHEVKLPVFRPGISVAYSALSLIGYFGFKKVITLGLDFCYNNGDLYAEQEPITYDDLLRKHPLFLKDAIRNTYAVTDEVLAYSRDILLKFVDEHKDMEIINGTGVGLFYGNGVKQQPFVDYLKEIGVNGFSS